MVPIVILSNNQSAYALIDNTFFPSLCCHYKESIDYSIYLGCILNECMRGFVLERNQRHR